MNILISLPLHLLNFVRNCGFPALLLAGLVLVSTSFARVNANASLNSTQMNAQDAGTFQVVELFTSLGCASCPAASNLLGELMAADTQLMGLEFHVDYWDTFVHEYDGNFVDPYSEPEFSRRQREYNGANLLGRPGVYTPQAVINGRTVTIGTDRRQVRQALNKPAHANMKLDISAVSDSDSLNVYLSSPKDSVAQFAGANIMLARYLHQTETEVTGGENKNKMLVNHHVVTSFEQIGQVPQVGDWSLRVALPSEGQGCVVLVQSERLNALHAAARCP